MEKIWGGDRLAKLKGLNSTEKIGETWEVAVLEEGSAKAGETSLREYYDTRTLPYIFKLIDTTDYLSVQVHPHDDYAQKHEDSKGKTECWLILDCDPGSNIYLGFKEGVKPEDFKAAIENGDDLTDFLWKHPVKKGDFFFVPAGSVHAIGPGILLAEIQQACGVTYRVWDWNRVDANGVGRELHVAKAMDVLNFEPSGNSEETFKIQKDLVNNAGKTGLDEFVSHNDFKGSFLRGVCEQTFIAKERPLCLMLLEGEAFELIDGEEKPLKKYSSYFLPVGHEMKVIQRNDFDLVLVVS